jgi:hypothetical protein
VPSWFGFRKERGLAFAAASADMKNILFETGHDLTADTAGFSESEPKAYEWDEGTVRLVGVLPGGEAASASVVGDGTSALHSEGSGSWTQFRHAISADGSRVIFEGAPLSMEGIKGITGDLYMRIDHTDTVQLNVSERSEPDPGGPRPATFWSATADDSKVFFSMKQALTNDTSGVGSERENIYEYDLNAPPGKHLTLISVDNEPGEEGIEGDRGQAVVGISADGSYVYFLGFNRLVPGQPPILKEGSASLFGELYVWHDGAVRAILSSENSSRGLPSWGQHRANPGGIGFGGDESGYRKTARRSCSKARTPRLRGAWATTTTTHRPR